MRKNDLLSCNHPPNKSLATKSATVSLPREGKSRQVLDGKVKKCTNLVRGTLCTATCRDISLETRQVNWKYSPLARHSFVVIVEISYGKDFLRNSGIETLVYLSSSREHEQYADTNSIYDQHNNKTRN